MGASLYYRGALAAAQFRARNLGGWVAERYRTTASGAMELLDIDTHDWHSPDLVWHDLLFNAWDEDLDAIRRARSAGQVVVADVDDDYWAIPHRNAAKAKWTPEVIAKYEQQLSACDAIIVSSEALAYRVARFGPPVYLIRNAVDTRWLPQHDPARKQVAWIGSTPWRANDLGLLRAAGLDQWLATHQQVAYHGGAMDPPEVPRGTLDVFGGARFEHPPNFGDLTGVDPSRVDTRPNVTFAQYPSLWEPVGVSLVPLEGVPYNRAKSWLKGLESCAAGVPVIASAGFTEYEALEAQGAVIRWARPHKPADWTRHLTELCDDQLRREEGRRNRIVAENCDITNRWLEWLAVFQDVAKRRIELLISCS